MQSQPFSWQVNVEIVRPSPLARKFALPKAETAGAAGMDLTACIDEPLRIQPGERLRVPTGIAIALPSPHLVALVFARSGLASRSGLTLVNGVGVIDSDYRGEIECPLLNTGDETVTIEPGHRIAQLVVVPVVGVTWREVDRLDETDRGTGGFGSTGE